VNTRANVSAQTDIRRKMLASGYTPLANKEKACVLKGWTSIEVTEAVIDEWDEQLAYQTTGLRIDPPLCVVDVDIDDERIVRRLWDWAADEWGEDWADLVLIRRGSGVKEAWLFKVDEPFHVPPGPKFVRPDEDPAAEDVDAHKVELFGGGAGRQIGAYGVHTPGKIDYGWEDDAGPAKVPRGRLPTLGKEDVFEIYAAYTEILEAEGWHRVPRSSPEELDGATRVYDLEPGQVLATHSRGEQRVDELVDGDRVRMREITGSGDNTTRGVVHTYEDGPGVWDAETGCVHLLQGAQPTPVSDTMQKLAQGLERAGYGPTLAEIREATADWLAGQEDQEAILAELTQRYVIWPGGGPRERVLDTEHPGRGYSMEGFAYLYPQKVEIDQGVYQVGEHAGEPKPPKKVPLVNIWAKSELPTLVHGLRYDPSTTERLVVDDRGDLRVNTYRPPELGTPSAEHERTWTDLLEHLFDVDEEREWFENWLAFKFQQPCSRGAFVALVAPAIEGSGRGTMFELIAGALGAHNVTLGLPSAAVTGQGPAAQYNEWQADKLLATINELSTTASAFGGRARTDLTDKLKATFEPSPSPITVNPKYGSTRTEMCYVSVIAATNSLDALMLDSLSENRRFAILSTGGKGKLIDQPDLFARLGRVRTGDWVCPDMAASVLNRYAVENWGPADRARFMEGPQTEAKEEMMHASEPLSHHVLRETLRRLEDAGRVIITVGELEAEATKVAKTMELPHDQMRYWRNDFPKALAKPGGFAGWGKLAQRVYVQGNRKATVAGTLEALRRFEDLGPAERTEALGTHAV
jgi:hypothetical protein